MKLSEEIRIITPEEANALRSGKLPQSKLNDKGFYLVCSEGRYIAFDYAERQFWIEFIGKEGMPDGYEKKFKDPLRAIDWLYETKE